MTRHVCTRLSESPSRGGFFRAGALLALTLLFALVWPRAARAETWGQYLVIIDDSGSMDGSDPQRLVMLASLALAASLSDADQLMIVGLNELANGEVTGPRFGSPRELLADRDGSEGERVLVGASFERMARLARHGGGTPCKAALDRAATILTAVSSSGAPQTLLLLTDGACSEPIEPAASWLARVESHAQGRFRFALLSKKQAGERIDPMLVEYARATGWTADPNVSFDSRSLLHAFAEVLSFSRGLRYDDGGRVGLARSFAGAREVRVLAVSTEGRAPISLAFTDTGPGKAAREDPLGGGPTFKHASFGWSLRVAKDGAHQLPFAVRSPDAGVEVLVIPSYGALQIEAIVGGCGEADRPKLPWTRERAVRSGQPACAYARLVGDDGQTIHPRDSFAFAIELCEDAQCSAATAMQPDSDGTFNAQLGVMPEGRSERWFRAHGGSLAQPLIAARGVSAVAFGITAVARAETPDQPINELDLGTLPQALPSLVTLEFSGSFPDGGQAQVRCDIVGDAGSSDLPADQRACLHCTAQPSTVTLQDPFTVQLDVGATSLCPLVSESLGTLPVALELVVTGVPGSGSGGGSGGEIEEFGTRRVPIRASLQYAKLEPQRAAITGGESGTAELVFPGPVNGVVTLELERTDDTHWDVPEDLQVTLEQPEVRVSGEPGAIAGVGIHMQAADCCSTGEHAFVLRVRDPNGGPSLELPVTVTVEKPSFWVCPGKTIAKWTALALALGLLAWLVRGFTSPAKFAETAVLARAESHAALAKINEGDEDWRLVRSLEITKRAFYTPATVHLGGPKAALPSLRELPADARIEARPHDNAALVVEAEGIETFKESTGWQPVQKGEMPIGSSIVLRRDNTYLMFRR